MPTCSSCQTEVAAGTAFCPSCGASMTAGVGPARASGSTSQLKFDASVLSQTDRIMGIASLILFISLFLPWFTAFGFSESALSAHGYLYIVLILALVEVAYFAATALGVWSLPASAPVSRDQVLLIASTINVVLILIAFVFKPSGLGIVHVGWAWGAFVGLVAAVVAFVPLGRPFIEARRKR
jgi:hypothetical protein